MFVKNHHLFIIYIELDFDSPQKCLRLTKYKRDNVLCLPQVEGSFQQAQEQPVVVGQYSPPRVIEILIIKFWFSFHFSTDSRTVILDARCKNWISSGWGKPFPKSYTFVNLNTTPLQPTSLRVFCHDRNNIFLWSAAQYTFDIFEVKWPHL